MVALARDADRRLLPIRLADGEVFESRVANQTDNWEPARESVVVPLALRPDAYRVVLGPTAEWLPPHLRTLLRSGVRFETTTDPRHASAFSLWMIAQPAGHRRRGRTGVLLEHGAPLVVADPKTGAEYLIELKGAGLPTGGYAVVPEWRALQGGLWERQGETEYDRLIRFANEGPEDAVLGLGFARFRGRFGGQDLLFRLTPGNLRASFRGPRLLAREPARVADLMRAIGARMGDVLASDHYAFTHPENFVIDQTGANAWTTDLLDVLPLTELPRKVENVWMDESRALIVTLELPKLFSDYDPTAHWSIFWGAVVDRLIERGTIAPSLRDTLVDLPDFVHAGLALLKNGFAARIFRDRVLHGYGPLDDPELAATLDTPCPTFDAREHGRLVTEMLESLAEVSRDRDGEGVFGKFILEAGLLARGKVTFLEWLTLPYTSGVIVEAMAIRLNESYIPPGEDDGVDMIRVMLRNSFPQWFALKRHLEREYRLIESALRSHPADKDLLRNQMALRQVAKKIASRSIEEFTELMCVRRTEFRSLFKLPYHRR